MHARDVSREEVGEVFIGCSGLPVECDDFAGGEHADAAWAGEGGARWGRGGAPWGVGAAYHGGVHAGFEAGVAGRVLVGVWQGRGRKGGLLLIVHGAVSAVCEVVGGPVDEED